MLAIAFLDSTCDRCHLAEGEVVMCLGGGSVVVDGRSSVHSRVLGDDRNAADPFPAPRDAVLLAATSSSEASCTITYAPQEYNNDGTQCLRRTFKIESPN